MQLPQLIFVSLALFAAATTATGDDTWDYPAGRKGVNQVSAGKAGQLRVYDCHTTDAVETVVLWYARRVGLKDDHSLVAAAANGFDKLAAEKEFNYGFGRDTGEKSDHTQLVAHVAPTHAHVMFHHRPDFNRPASVTISLAKTPTGTSVHVIQPIPRSAEEESP